MFLHYGLLSTTILQMELDFQSHVKLLRSKYSDRRDQIMQQIEDHTLQVIEIIDHCYIQQAVSTATEQTLIGQIGIGNGDGITDMVPYLRAQLCM